MGQFQELLELDDKIETIELFLIQVETPRHFSFGTWESRQHVFIKISVKKLCGWGEEIAALNCPEFDLANWGEKIENFKGMKISDGFQLLKRKIHLWDMRLCEAVEMALIDLSGKILNKPALELLGLSNSGTVAGLSCILENNEDKVTTKAEAAKHFGFSHLKLKLFGDVQFDSMLIQKARESFGYEGYIIGDTNMAYRRHYHSDPNNLNDITNPLEKLTEAGLSACEDPGNLDVNQWVNLQRELNNLDLIPDEPMRVSSKAIDTIVPNMGSSYNIHPGSAGSLISAVLLGEKIQSFGGMVMIGDDSLVGPACNVWQQLAIGLGAICVEALEKELEFPFSSKLLEDSPVRVINGQIKMSQVLSGFGMEIEEEHLKEMSSKRYMI